MVGVTKIGAKNASYWINAVREGGDDYYTKPGEAPGEWMGSLAVEAGLSGEIDGDDYAAVLAGKMPGTGQVLVARPEPRTYVDAQGRERKMEPTLGYDIRFSAPKSVSILYAIGPPQVRDAILDSHNEAVAAALSHLEKTACWVARGKGGNRFEPGTGFFGMGFLHRSSRAGDMALHTHLLVSNMTRAVSDGRWLSLANPKRSSPFFREAKAAGHIYHAVMRAGVTRRTGLEWAQPHNGYADLVVIERAVIEHFSRRRAEILAAMAERGATSAAAAEVAAYRTRADKDYGVDMDTQREEWIARAAEFDLTPAKIERFANAARARQPRPIEQADLDGALSDLEARHSHFDRRDLLCALATRLQEGADLDALEGAVVRLLDSSRLIEIHRGSEPVAATYYTTARLWELERKVLRSAREGRDAGVAVVDERTLAAVLARHRYLSGEQQTMVRRLTTGGERIVAVAALPGAGKTTALAAAREAWAAEGIRGIGIATARSASAELAESAGIPSTSVTDLLIRMELRVERGLPALPRGAVIVVDEASTTPTPDLAQVVAHVEACECKLVMIGDPNQIGAVGPGGVYGHLTKELEVITLLEIRRQRDPVDRRVVELAHEGRGSDALDLLRTRDRLLVADTLDEALDAQVLDWHRSFAAGQDAVMIARRNWDVAALNERARELRHERGELGASLEVAGQEFSVGDRIITRVNTRQVSNRERWEVVEVKPADRRLVVRRIGEADEGAVLDRAYLDRRTPNGEPSIQHAYAITTYASESKTFDEAFTFLDAGISREDFVVAVSRSRGPTTAYAVAAGELLDADLGPATREVEDPAHDIRSGAERVAEEYAASQVHIRKRLEALPPAELALRRAELEERVAGRQEPSPDAERLARLEQRIGKGTERVNALRGELEALRSQRRPDRDQLAQAQAALRHSENRLGQLEKDHSALAKGVSSQGGAPPTSRDRLELTLIDEQMTRLYRRQVALERLRPSEMILNTLGPRPTDPVKAVQWNAGVDLIHGYRQRYGITSPTGHPLGPHSGDAARRRARQAAEQRLSRIQQRLHQERQRKVERVMQLFR